MKMPNQLTAEQHQRLARDAAERARDKPEDFPAGCGVCLIPEVEGVWLLWLNRRTSTQQQEMAALRRRIAAEGIAELASATALDLSKGEPCAYALVLDAGPEKYVTLRKIVHEVTEEFVRRCEADLAAMPKRDG